MAASSPSHRAAHVVLARHGRTPLNADGRLRGRLDPALDPVGEHEVTALARALYPMHPSQVITSPLRRARQTAAALAQRYLIPITVDDRLTDRDFGPWAGEREDEVIARWGSLDDAPDVEPLPSVVERAMAVLNAVGDADAAGAVVLVSHQAVNCAVLAALQGHGRPELVSQRTACWNVIEGRSGGWHVTDVDRKAVP
ncbi:MAG TPA: histidine phosphatase family protein [Angustibacter sp.]|jgi:broad specificity phosphatase PhoE|nr:histidine phosphatase family protein [Angustibacter sp.]